MAKERIITISILALIILAAAAFTYYFVFVQSHVREDAAASRALKTGDGVASYTDINGETRTLDDFLGNVLVVSSWASWCPQCASDLPQLASLAAEFDNEKVTFIAINRSENRFTAQRFLESIDSTETLEIVLDPDDHFFTSNEGYAMPETILYDREGNTLLHQRGELRVDVLREAINQAL